MKEKQTVEFTKMNGAGNDFIIIDNREHQFSPGRLVDMAKKYCRRRFSIGADGLMVLSDSDKEGALFRMIYFNADGSSGTMCGNGARCMARYARDNGFDRREMIFETDAGPVKAVVPDLVEHPVRIYFDPPAHFSPNIVLSCEKAAAGRPKHYIWTGIEHLVCYVDNVETTPVSAWGALIRSDETLAPVGANVDFAQLVAGGDETSRARVRVRTFEKGVEDETYACGTGAMAVAVVSRMLGHIQSSYVDVEMPGGLLSVGFVFEEGRVRDLYLEGPADTAYKGYLDI